MIKMIFGVGPNFYNISFNQISVQVYHYSFISENRHDSSSAQFGPLFFEIQSGKVSFYFMLKGGARDAQPGGGGGYGGLECPIRMVGIAHILLN